MSLETKFAILNKGGFHIAKRGPEQAKEPEFVGAALEEAGQELLQEVRHSEVLFHQIINHVILFVAAFGALMYYLPIKLGFAIWILGFIALIFLAVYVKAVERTREDCRMTALLIWSELLKDAPEAIKGRMQLILREDLKPRTSSPLAQIIGVSAAITFWVLLGLWILI